MPIFIHFVFICILLNLYAYIIDIYFNHYANSTIWPLWYLLYDVDIADYWVSTTFFNLQLMTLLKNKIIVLKCFGAHVLIYIQVSIEAKPISFFFLPLTEQTLALFYSNLSNIVLITYLNINCLNSRDNCKWCECLIFRFTKISC